MGNRLKSLEAYRINAFQAHCRIVQMQYLEPWIKCIQNDEAFQEQFRSALECRKESIGALIVDDRPTQQLRACVLNTLLMGWGRWQVVVYTTSSALEAMSSLLADLVPFVRVCCLSQVSHEFGWNGYNQLFKNPAFWVDLEYRKVLIFQTDTLLIRPVDDSFFLYDYVGSPWAKNRYDSHSFPRYANGLIRVAPVMESRVFCQSVPDGLVNGNGGLSIRDTRVMARICENKAKESPPEEAEDIFFARYLDSFSSSVAPFETVQAFSCETEYRDCCGAHAAWRYIDARDCASLYEEHCKQVVAIIQAITNQEMA